MSQRGSIIFCATGKSGIGHIRRITNVAGALVEAAPGTSVELIVNAPPDGLSPVELRRFSDIHVVEREKMTALIARREPGMVVVDTAKIPGLGLLPVPLFLLLRETRMERVHEFRLAHGRQWHRVFIPAPETAWTVSAGTIGATAVENVGWIYRSPEPHAGTPAFDRQTGESIMLIATGGGGALGVSADMPAAIAGFIRRVKGRLPHLRVVQALGPRAGRDMVFDGVDDVVDVASRLNAAFADADLVLSTSGYNSVLELAQTTTPSLLMAVPRSFDDQEQRARAWGARLGRYFDPDATDALVAWSVDTLRQGARRPALNLGPCGSGRIAQALLAAARTRSIEARADEFALFIKTYARRPYALAGAGREPPEGSIRATQRASALQAAGIATPLSMPAAGSGDRVVMPRLKGDTVRTHLTAQVEPSGTSDGSTFSAWAGPIAACLRALHDVDPAPLALSPFDPWAKIEPRLAPPNAAASMLERAGLTANVAQLVVQARACLDAANTASGPRPATVLHGDFHCGQMIAPPGDEALVLLDLDDLCLGDPEADLANFTAHFATTPELARQPVAQALATVSAAMVSAYTSMSKAPFDEPLFEAHQAVALLRRVAKLAESGADAARLREILEACRELTARKASRPSPAPRPEDRGMPRYARRVSAAGGAARNGVSGKSAGGIIG